MKFYTGYYWQQGNERTTLVLKHLVYHNGQPVCFAALFECCENSEKEGAFLAEKLKEWIYDEGVELCGKKGREPECLKKHLEKRLGRLWKSAESAAAVLICLGEYFVLWSRGTVSVCLLNYRLGKPHARFLAQEDQEDMLCGEFGKHTGILLTTGDFGRLVPTEKIAECLDMKTLECEDKVQKHLKELGNLAVRKGGQQVGCVLVKAV